MLRIKLLLVGLFLSLTSWGQDHYFELNAGGNLNFNQRENFEYYKVAPGVTFGAGYRFLKNNWFSNTTIGYQGKGFSQQLLLVDTAGTIFDGPNEFNRHHYLYAEERVGYQFGRVWKFEISTGANFSFYNGSRITAPNFEEGPAVLNGYDIIVNNLIKPDISACINVGIGKGSYRFDFNFQRSLHGINFNSAPSPHSWRNNLFTVRWTSYFKFKSASSGNIDEDE